MSDEPVKSGELATAIRIWAFIAAMIAGVALVIWMGWDANSGFWRGLTWIVWGVLSHIK